jgi:hypothetical protein
MRFVFIIGLAHERMHVLARCISAIFSIAAQFFIWKAVCIPWVCGRAIPAHHFSRKDIRPTTSPVLLHPFTADTTFSLLIAQLLLDTKITKAQTGVGHGHE